MTFYDIVMLVIFIGAVIHGYWKGLAWQIASVAAIVISYFVAMNFRTQVAQMLPIEQPWDRIAAMLILFLGCSLAIWMAYAFVTKSMENLELKGFDRQAGALVGGITGALLCMVVTMFSVSFIGDKASQSIAQSKLGPYVVTGIDKVSSVIPTEMVPYVHQYVVQWENQRPDFENQPGMPQSETGVYPTYTDNNGLVPATQPQGGWSAQPAGFTNPPTSGGRIFGATPRQPSTDGGTQTNQGGIGTPKIEINVDAEDLLNRIERLLQRDPNGG